MSYRPLLPGSFNVLVSWPVDTFHRYVLPLVSPAASVLPSGLNATPYTLLPPGSWKLFVEVELALPPPTFHR